MDRRGWVRGSCIGKGSFGTVSLAYSRSDGRSFAVKSVGLNCNSHPTAATSLEKEIQILKSLDSPYVVSYLGDSTTRESCDTWRNLHMEYVPGGTLAELAMATAMSEADIRSYTRCIVLALRYLHSVAGVVHSDVKGRNVLAGPTKGVAKIADFGAARRIGAGNEQDVIGGGGTPLWMAPEVARGGVAAPESDIWSLGCTVIEMATGGAHPWRRSNNCISNGDEDRLVFRIGYGTELPEFPLRLSKQGRDFLDKCLRRNAGERWSAERLLEHPFLADVVVDDADRVLDFRSSPRSVLDNEWGYSEDDEEEEEVVMDTIFRERIRELASDGVGMLHWDWKDEDDDDDWVVVRISYSDEEEEGEYSDSCNRKLEDCCDGDDDYEASGSGLSNRMPIDAAATAVVCFSNCCKLSCLWSFSCCSCKRFPQGLWVANRNFMLRFYQRLFEFIEINFLYNS